MYVSPPLTVLEPSAVTDFCAELTIFKMYKRHAPSELQKTNKRFKQTFVTPPRPLTRRAVTNESGFVDTAVTGYVFDTSTGSIALLSTIPQGTSVNQRVGKKVQLKSLQCRGFVYNNTTASYTDNALLIVYDRRPTGTLPLVTDVLNTIDSLSMNNDVNSGRFQILKRLDFELIGNAASQFTDKMALSADFYLDLKGKSWVAKSLGTGTIADTEEGAVYLITVGSQPAGTSAASAQLGFRLRFMDV